MIRTNCQFDQVRFALPITQSKDSSSASTKPTPLPTTSTNHTHPRWDFTGTLQILHRFCNLLSKYTHPGATISKSTLSVFLLALLEKQRRRATVRHKTAKIPRKNPENVTEIHKTHEPLESVFDVLDEIPRIHSQHERVFVRIEDHEADFEISELGSCDRN